MKLIKNTTGFSPELKPQACSVFEDDGRVFLVKGDGAARYLLERDPGFYKKLNIDYRTCAQGFDRIMIDVTTRCNLKCSVCYRMSDTSEDIDILQLEGLARQFSKKIISICGGEPTMRTDLPQIIRLFSRKNTVFLITNGIKLAQYDYLRELKASGLGYVSFSLNGLSEDTLAAINEAGILSDKLQALENLKRLGIKTVLAVVLVRGINEKELPKIFDFCLRNRDFIEELRIRGMAPLGSHLAGERFCISEMLDVVTRSLGISKEGALREFEIKRAINTLCKREIFNLKSCTFDFHLKSAGGRVFAAGEDIAGGVVGSSLERLRPKITLACGLLKLYGFGTFAAGLLKSLLRTDFIPWVHSKKLFKLGLRSWPDINTIDLEENGRCRTGYWLDGRLISFCRANIIKNASRQRHV